MLVIGALAFSAVAARTGWVFLTGGAVIPVSFHAPAASTDELRSILVRAGLDSELLTAAGVTPQQVPSTLEAALEEAASVATTLSAADADVRSNKQNCDKLMRIVQSGGASEQHKTDLAAARAALATAKAAQQSSLDQVFESGVAEMSESQSRIAGRIRANRHWSLPLHHLAVATDARTESDWIELRNALSRKASVLQCGDEECSEANGVIAASEGIADVAAAKVNLAANADDVAEAWDNAISGG